MSAPGDRSGMDRRVPGTVARPSSPQDTCAGMVRVVVRLRPEQYDELFRHARASGLTMSAFFRESALNAMREEHSDTEPVRPVRRMAGRQQP